MEAKRQRYQHNNYSIEGNTARSLQAVPGYREDEEYERRQRPVRKVRKKPKAKVGVDLFAMLFLTVAIILTVYTCVEYLGVQSRVSAMNKQIAKLEDNLLKMRNENDAALTSLNTSLDLNYIYKVATEELGMVYPKDNQVISYKSNLSDYVRQYEDIPEDEDSTLLDKINK
jgi:cell division protein FtsB